MLYRLPSKESPLTELHTSGTLRLRSIMCLLQLRRDTSNHQQRRQEKSGKLNVKLEQPPPIGRCNASEGAACTKNVQRFRVTVAACAVTADDTGRHRAPAKSMVEGHDRLVGRREQRRLHTGKCGSCRDQEGVGEREHDGQADDDDQHA